MAQILDEMEVNIIINGLKNYLSESFYTELAVSSCLVWLFFGWLPF